MMTLSRFFVSSSTRILNIFRRNSLELPDFSNCRLMSSQSATSDLKRIFSGIQPTGMLHLGNFFGAVQQWVNLQKTGHDSIFCIVDMHAITVSKEPSVLHDNINRMAAMLLACGLDPEKCILFQQSKVHHHAELCWILICSTFMGRLGQQPQFKDKTSNMKEIPLGLYIYPVLQAADILLYKSTHVPVGVDQVPHLELTRQLAQKFNKTYGDTFLIPRTMLTNAARIKSLRDPMKKMSKSDPDMKSCISLTDSDSDIVLKCKKAVTDCTSAVTYDPEKRPGVTNLILIHSCITGKSPEEICREVEKLDTAQYKIVLADVLIEWIRPIRTRAQELLTDPFYVQDVLLKGSKKASQIAETTMEIVRQRVGFEKITEELKVKGMQKP